MKLSLITAAIVLLGMSASAESHVAPVGDLISEALASGDVEAGEKVYRKCRACHDVGEDARAKVGPPLNNMIGVALGTYDGFRFSDGIVELGETGVVWTVETLDAFLLKPRDYISGTRMTFAGLRDAEDRADVIAYLASLTDVE